MAGGLSFAAEPIVDTLGCPPTLLPSSCTQIFPNRSLFFSQFSTRPILRCEFCWTAPGFFPYCYWSKVDMFPGKGNGTLLQYSCLENPIDRGAWWAAVHGVAKSWTWLRMHTHPYTYRDMLPKFAKENWKDLSLIPWQCVHSHLSLSGV